MARSMKKRKKDGRPGKECDNLVDRIVCVHDAWFGALKHRMFEF